MENKIVVSEFYKSIFCEVFINENSKYHASCDNPFDEGLLESIECEASIEAVELLKDLLEREYIKSGMVGIITTCDDDSYPM